MPLIELPLNKGTGVDGPTSRYIDLYNFNFVYIPKDTDGKAYYLRNFPGVTNLYLLCMPYIQNPITSQSVKQ